MFRSIQFFFWCHNYLQLIVIKKKQYSIPKRNMQNTSLSTYSKGRRIQWLHVVVLRRMTRKSTKIYNARAKPISCLKTFTLPSPSLFFFKYNQVNRAQPIHDLLFLLFLSVLFCVWLSVINPVVPTATNSANVLWVEGLGGMQEDDNKLAWRLRGS